MQRHDRNQLQKTTDTNSYLYRDGVCTAVMGSMTNALQAQKALANAAIYVSVRKVSASGSTNGCSYGVSYPCSAVSNVRAVLSSAGLSVKKYMGG